MVWTIFKLPALKSIKAGWQRAKNDNEHILKKACAHDYLK